MMMKDLNAKLTVVAITYMHAPYVRAALEGIAAQTVRDFELVIIDDGSTDGTAEIVRAWVEDFDGPVVLRLHERNVGFMATLQEARDLVTGEWIAGISLDDVWDSTRLEQHMDLIAHAPDDVAAIYSNIRVVHGPANEPVSDDFLGDVCKLRPPPSGDVFLDLLSENFIAAAVTTYRRSAIEAVGGYDPSLTFEDWDMLLRLARRFQIVYSPGVVGTYRRHGGSHLANWRLDDDRSSAELFRKHVGVSRAADRYIARRLVQYGRPLARARQPEGEQYLRMARRLSREPKVVIVSRLAQWGCPEPCVELVADFVPRVRWQIAHRWNRARR